MGGIVRQQTLVFGSTFVVAFLAAWISQAQAQQAVVGPTYSPPFTATDSNNVPLAFGMDEVTAANALGSGPLKYVGGPPGNEVFLALRSYGRGTYAGFFNDKHRLYLQFRSGRLVGWKGDWGNNWMWR